MRVCVAVGDRVEAGAVLLHLESMKMEQPIEANLSGSVAELFVEEGEQIEAGSLVVRIEEEE